MKIAQPIIFGLKSKSSVLLIFRGALNSNRRFVYASGSQFLLVNLYRGMSLKADCRGACTTAASTLDLLHRIKPGILIVYGDLPDQSLGGLIEQAKAIQPSLRTIAIVTRHDQFMNDCPSPIIIADQDFLYHPETTTLMAMAVVTNTTYHSPLILSRLGQLDQQPPAVLEGVYKLSLRERQLLEAYALGLSNKETAERLGLTVRTVQTYSTNLLQKLGTNNRQKALRRAISLGFHALGEIVRDS
jgi:DNA-binding NarL/FixJ family response regulator